MQGMEQKPPSVAAWDRTLRKVLRLADRVGLPASDSFLEDLFDTYSDADGLLGREEFQLLLHSHGYNKDEAAFFDNCFLQATTSMVADDEDEVENYGERVSLETFLQLFLQEPPAQLLPGSFLKQVDIHKLRQKIKLKK